MVSVIIPAYNYGRFIGETLASVAAQTYTGFECIIVDNGSTDNTAEEVKPFLGDARFRYLRQANLGVSAARNTGLHYATGEFVQFLDADDLIEKNKLSAAVDFLERNQEITMVYSDLRYFKSGFQDALFFGYRCDINNDAPWMCYLSGGGREVVKRILEGNAMVISSPVFRKETLQETGEFDESLQYNEDWDFWLRIVLAGKRIHFLDLPDTKTLIRVHTTSASSDIFKMQVSGLKVLIKNAEKIKSFELDHELNRRMKDHRLAIQRSMARATMAEFGKMMGMLRGMSVLPLVFQIQNTFLIRLLLKIRYVFSR
jgi:glycosyltransferase involved in cell wall biosynthesis